jgi:hypothetical protein
MRKYATLLAVPSIAAALFFAVPQAGCQLAVAQDVPPGPVPDSKSPVAKITGPENAFIGDLIVLSAADSQNAVGFTWVLLDSDKPFMPVEFDRKIVFSSGSPGKYNFIVVAANADSNGRPKVNVARHVVSIGYGPGPIPPAPQPPVPPPGPGPQPPAPNPDNPTPPPAPVVPDGMFGLTKISYLAAKTIDQEGQSQIFAVSKAHRTAARKAAALSDSRVILKGRKVLVQEALGITDDSTDEEIKKIDKSWLQYKATISAALEKLDLQDKKLKEGSDWAEAFDETAEGLEIYLAEQEAKKKKQ